MGLKSLLEPKNIKELQSILEYHVISGAAVRAEDLKASQNVKTLEGQEVHINKISGSVTVQNAKVDTPAFSCNAVSCAKKNFFKTAETGACLALKCFTDPASATCQACAHKNCDAQATACTGLAVLPPNPSENCGSK